MFSRPVEKVSFLDILFSNVVSYVCEAYFVGLV